MTLNGSAVGTEGSVTVTVDSSLSADAYGNAGLQALATPALVGLFEKAAMRGLEALLEDDQRSVGSAVELEHQAPTPVGDSVTVRAQITEVDGAKIWFEVSASDSNGPIASGRHSRFIVDDARFRARLERHPGATPSGLGAP